MSLIEQNYFDLFGLAKKYAQCPKKIKAAYIKLLQEHHPDRFVQASNSAKRLADDGAAYINLAYKTLLSPISRALYLLKIQGVTVEPDASLAMPGDFLMEQMELREQLAELKASPDELQLATIRAIIEENLGALEQTLEHNAHDNNAVLMCIQKMQFYAKLTDEVEALESAWDY